MSYLHIVYIRGTPHSFVFPRVHVALPCDIPRPQECYTPSSLYQTLPVFPLDFGDSLLYCNTQDKRALRLAGANAFSVLILLYRN